MSSEWEYVNAIGETAERLREAYDVIVGAIVKTVGPETGRIGTFVHPGPEESEYPWLIMVGPAPVMCEHASKTARKAVKQLLRKIKEMEGDE